MPYISFTDESMVEVAASRAHFPVGSGALISWFVDNFEGASVKSSLWTVTGSPSVSSSEVNLTAGTSIRSRRSFAPPCAVEVVGTMIGTRAANDNSIIQFVSADGLVFARIRFAGTANAADLLVSDGTVTDTATGLGILTDGTYRNILLLVDSSRVVLAHRTVNTTGDPTIARMVNIVVPATRMSLSLSTDSETTNPLRIHSVFVYQLAGLVPNIMRNI